MEAHCGTVSTRAQTIVEFDGQAAARLAVEERAVRHGDVQHLFDAQRLGAELDFIGVVRFGPAAFVLDRERRDDLFSAIGERDTIGHAGKAKLQRAQGDTARDARVAAGFAAELMNAGVQDAAFGGVLVAVPEAFEMNERALSRAEDEMLQRGERQHLVF